MKQEKPMRPVGDAITPKERHFSPLSAILENIRVTLFH
jgi:hypothetical protein